MQLPLQSCKTLVNNRLLGAATAGTVGEVQVQTTWLPMMQLLSQNLVLLTLVQPVNSCKRLLVVWIGPLWHQAFPTGTKMLFNQTSAPTGWTKDTTNNDNSAIRVVTGSVGTGGSDGFTTTFVWVKQLQVTH